MVTGVSMGCRVWAVVQKGETAAWLACARGHCDVLDALLRAGAKVSFTSQVQSLAANGRERLLVSGLCLFAAAAVRVSDLSVVVVFEAAAALTFRAAEFPTRVCGADTTTFGLAVGVGCCRMDRARWRSQSSTDTLGW